MVAARDIQPPALSPDEYLDWEPKQLEKYEYLEGQVHAMTGGTINHGRLGIRFTSLFDTHLENTRCIAGNSDIKINICGSANYTYPDASVTCDERDLSNSQYITYPCLLVEILSDSTEGYDRGEKFRLYRKNPSLIDYLMVNSTKIEMDLYHKNEAGEWIIINYQAGDIICLESINLRFPIEQVYRGLTLTTESPTTAPSE
ncbi:MAG: Uma2 family endonuclease [Cyanobacteria bacterium P01_H01_bin.15]